MSKAQELFRTGKIKGSEFLSVVLRSTVRVKLSEAQFRVWCRQAEALRHYDQEMIADVIRYWFNPENSAFIRTLEDFPGNEKAMKWFVANHLRLIDNYWKESPSSKAVAELERLYRLPDNRGL